MEENKMKMTAEEVYEKCWAYEGKDTAVMEHLVPYEEIEVNVMHVAGLTVINATPHELNVIQRNGCVLSIQPSGIIPRCASTEEVDQAIGLIDVTKQTLGNVEGLPKDKPGTYYIVSRLVAQASKRWDLLVPGPLVRDDQGRVVGCKGLSRL